MPFSPPCVFPGKRAGKGRFSTPLRAGKFFDSTQIPLFSKGKSTLQNCPFSVRRLVGKPLQRFGLRWWHRRLWAESPVIFQAAAQTVRFPSSGRDRNGKPGYFCLPGARAETRRIAAGKQVFRLFHAGPFTGKPSQNLGLFRLKIFAAIPVVQCRPVHAARLV